MEARGDSQAQVARRLQISPSYLSSVLSGARPLNTTLLEDLCHVLDLKTDRVLRFKKGL